MKRLRKTSSDIHDAEVLLKRIDEACANLKDVYYVLFDNLNVLFQNYPDIYKQIEMIVKLPTNESAKDIVTLYNDLHSTILHFDDTEYLQKYIKENISN